MSLRGTSKCGLNVLCQVQRVLQDLEMGNIQDVLAQNLSSGQKRKLTFGTAILGDPRVSRPEITGEIRWRVVKLWCAITFNL